MYYNEHGILTIVPVYRNCNNRIPDYDKLDDSLIELNANNARIGPDPVSTEQASTASGLSK